MKFGVRAQFTISNNPLSCFSSFFDFSTKKNHLEETPLAIWPNTDTKCEIIDVPFILAI